VAASVLLCGALAAAPARAQLELRWDAPVECPTADDVRAEVTRLLGGSMPPDLSLRADGEATRSDDGWTMHLRTSMGGEDGEREIAGERCEELGEAAALILALMIDPAAVAETEAAEPTPPEPVTETTDEEPEAGRAVSELSEPTPPEVADEEPTTTREIERVVESVRITDRATVQESSARDEADPPEPFAAFLGLSGGADLGSVPTASGMVSLEGGFGIPLIEGRLRATFVFGQRAARGDDDGADVTTGTLDARACVHPFEEARWVYGCLGLALGVSVAEGFGLSRDEVGVGTFGAAVGGLGVAWVIAPWFDLELDATVLVPFNPLEFAVRASPDEIFHRQEPLAGRLSLAAHVRFR